MSGKIVIVMLIALALGGYYRYSGMTFSSAKPAAAKQAVAPPQQQQSQVMGSADQAYLVNAMQRAGNNYRSWKEGVTVQNISLPSGKAMKMTVTKTKTGWCPKRRENLYHIGVSVSE
jgi:Flp pilus assembly protein CpaB